MNDRLVTDDDMDMLYVIHRAIGRDVEAFAQVVPTLTQGDSERVTGLRDWYHFLERTVDLHHRGEDDEICPILTAKVPEFEVHQARIKDEHANLLVLMAQAKDGFEALTLASTDHWIASRDELSVALATLDEAMKSHLSGEENDLLGCMKTCMSLRELKDFEKAGAKKTSMSDISVLLPWVLSAATEEEKEKFMEIFPWFVKLLYRLWWKRKFERMASPLGAL